MSVARLLFNLRPLSVPTQTCSQTELENWITAIHSACATAVARQHHREDTVRLLRAEIKKLEQKIDMDEKMKKMGDMQLSAVTDTKKRKTILDQVGSILLSDCSLCLSELSGSCVRFWGVLSWLEESGNVMDSLRKSGKWFSELLSAWYSLSIVLVFIFRTLETLIFTACYIIVAC